MEEQGEGPAVLFIHGSGPGASGWSNFKRNYPAFAEAGFRTLIPDTLGYGYSSKPEDGTELSALILAPSRGEESDTDGMLVASEVEAATS